MELTRRVVELGRAARATSGVKTRQPLQRALVAANGWELVPESLRAHIRDEVNVVELESLSDTAELVDVSVKANFKSLGARFAKETPAIAQVIASSNAQDLVNALRLGPSEIIVNGATVTITIDDVVITEVPREGWTVASDNGESLALDLELNAELIAQGIARDVTRLIQDARKASGFEISDRIVVAWQSDSPEVIDAMNKFGDQISQEVLATQWVNATVDNPVVNDVELGLQIQINKA